MVEKAKVVVTYSSWWHIMLGCQGEEAGRRGSWVGLQLWVVQAGKDTRCHRLHAVQHIKAGFG